MVLKKKVEVCCADISSVAAAEKAGAPRIELCAALPLGGVTPSVGAMAMARRIFSGKIHVLVRIRDGNFVYNSDEKEAMYLDLPAVAAAGCDGVVVGALNADGSIDREFAAKMAETAHKLHLSITFHRAFDVCNDRKSTLDTLISLGYDRVLTSGGADDALTGAEELAALNRQADGRIIILPGGGVTANNAAEIIDTVGTTEIHGSCRLKGGLSSDTNVITDIMHIINHE